MILFALILTVLVIIIALVIDFSFVRNSRQDGKTTSDSATAAGIASLAEDGIPKPWRGVCDALNYVRANQPERTFSVTYMDGAGNPASGSPCTTSLNQACIPNNRSSWGWARAVDGDYVIDIRSGYETPDPNFPEDGEEYASDASDPTRGSCDQLAVIVSKQDDAYFGGILGETSYDTAIRSVGRVTIESTPGDAVPAFLILERTDCGVLFQRVGSSEGGIIVEEVSSTEGGAIHVDSTGAPCVGSNGNNENAFVVFSDTLGTGRSKRPGLRVDGPGAGEKGTLSLHALGAGNTTNAWATDDGVFAEPVDGPIISRVVVDRKYNPSDTPTIKTLHEQARALALATTAPAGYTEVASGGSCNNQAVTSPALKVFINCPDGYSPNNAQFSLATDVVSNGPITVANDDSLFMPLVQNVVVGGTSSGGLMVNGGGRLGINSTVFADTDAGVSAACSAPDGPASRIATVVVFGGAPSGGGTAGALNVGGRAALCKSTVYLAGPKSLATHNAQQITNGSYHTSCVPATPCALTDSSNVAQHAQLELTGGYVRWTAPNRTNTQPSGNQGTEDLALWTEAPQDSGVKSGGVLDVQGVFFLPNAVMKMSSPASFTPRDAQFIANKLQLLQGTLQMKPSSGNNVQVELKVTTSMVR